MKKEIIDTAINEFIHNGFRFTMDDVARKMGMSKKTIYTVFASKEMLMDAMIDQYFDDFFRLREEVAKNAEMDTISKIETIVCAMPDQYYNIDVSKLYELWEKYPRLHKKFEDYINQVWEMVESYIVKGIENGEIRDVSVPLLMTMIRGCTREIISSHLMTGRGISFDEMKKRMMNILICGIRPTEKERD